MPAEVETMAYVGQTPWHGLGSQVNANMSIEEMLKAAGLDWRVYQQNLYTRSTYLRNGNGEYKVVQIPGKKAIMRDKDDHCFGVFSDGFTPVQNVEVMEFFREYVEAGGMQLETAGSLKHGAIIWCLASIGKNFTLAGGDKVEGYVLLSNSHDGSLCYQGQYTSIRVVCQNTLQAAYGDKKYGRAFKMKHSRKFTPEVLKDAKKQMGLAVEAFDRLYEVADALSSVKVDPASQEVMTYVAQLVYPDLLEKMLTHHEVSIEQGADILDAIAAEHDAGIKPISKDDFNRVGRAILDDIVDSPGSKLKAAKGTWWGVLSGVTHYVDHVAGRERDSALTSAWFGERATLKQNALNLAVQYAQKVA